MYLFFFLSRSMYWLYAREQWIIYAIMKFCTESGKNNSTKDEWTNKHEKRSREKTRERERKAEAETKTRKEKIWSLNKNIRVIFLCFIAISSSATFFGCVSLFILVPTVFLLLFFFISSGHGEFFTTTFETIQKMHSEHGSFDSHKWNL